MFNYKKLLQFICSLGLLAIIFIQPCKAQTMKITSPAKAQIHLVSINNSQKALNHNKPQPYELEWSLNLLPKNFIVGSMAISIQLNSNSNEGVCGIPIEIEYVDEDNASISNNQQSFSYNIPAGHTDIPTIKIATNLNYKGLISYSITVIYDENGIFTELSITVNY